MPTFEELSDALTFMKQNKPPAGMRWLYTHDGADTEDSTGVSSETIRVFAEEKWPIDDVDKSGDPHP